MKSIINIFLLISIVLLGCSSYQKPDVTVNNRWSVSDRNLILSESNLPYLAWWQGFNDPLLNQLIESGMVNNNTLNMSRGHIEAAAGELKKFNSSGFQILMSCWVIPTIQQRVFRGY